MSRLGTLSGTLRRASMSSEHAKGMAHHGSARDLAERSDVRQPGRAVAGFENHLVLGMPLKACGEPARFLERPGVRALCQRLQLPRPGFDCRHQAIPPAWR